jgi:hypothetical protein
MVVNLFTRLSRIHLIRGSPLLQCTKQVGNRSYRCLGHSSSVGGFGDGILLLSCKRGSHPTGLVDFMAWKTQQSCRNTADCSDLACKKSEKWYQPQAVLVRGPGYCACVHNHFTTLHVSLQGHCNLLYICHRTV